MFGQPPRVGGQGFEAGLAAGELPGLVRDGEVEFQREGGEVGRGQAEQAAEVYKRGWRGRRWSGRSMIPLRLRASAAALFFAFNRVNRFNPEMRKPFGPPTRLPVCGSWTMGRTPAQWYPVHRSRRSFWLVG